MRYIFIILCFISLSVKAQVYNLDFPKEMVINTIETNTLDSADINTLNTDSINMGDITIDPVNGLRLNGTASQWDDMTISALSLAGGVQSPTVRTAIGGIGTVAFNYAVANDIVYGLVQLPHGWVFADSVEVHYHGMIETTPSAGDTVVMDFEYSWADINEVFPTTDTIQLKIPVASWTAKQHKLVEIGWIQGADKTMSSNLLFRIERRQDLDSDTYDASANWFHLLDIDVHYKRNKLGSNNITSD